MVPNDCSCSDEADSGCDLSRYAGWVDIRTGRDVGETVSASNGEQGRADRDERVCSDTGRALARLTLKADNGPEACCDN
jgi:hypothetical protein